MKLITTALLVLLLSKQANANFRNIELQAAGLTCSMCSNAINKALRTLPEVADITTDLKNNLFVITLKEGARPDFDAISAKVEGAGFSVGKLTVEYNFSNTAVRKDEHVKLDDNIFHFVDVKAQTLDGWQRIQLVDQHFMLPKQYKKLAGGNKSDCMKTGLAANCCPDTGSGSKRIYHVTI